MGFSRNLREELKPHGIRVVTVMPGAVLTDAWAGVDLPESRFIDADEVAELVYLSATLSARTVVEDIVIRPQLGDI
jgi:NAD(P)-dependent dehydrogenase (short-subunit alcohol dehydrogenase family)